MKRIAFIICFLYSFCCFTFANKNFFNEILNKSSVCEENTIKFGSIIINEIMANPKGINVLPESEYIELYNRTDNVISLKKCTLNYGGKKYLLPDITVDTKNYIVLCNQKYKDLWTANGILVTGVSSFPALLNTGKLLWLEDEYGNLISWVEYTDSWYKDNKKKDGGYSLECIDPDNLSNDALNWCATTDSKGGTPGKANSLKKSLPDKAKIDVLSSFIQSSDTLAINFSKPMNVISLGRLDNYTSLNSAISFNNAIPDYPCGRNVKLILNSSLKVGEKVEIKLHDLIDVSGNTLMAPIALEVSIPEQVETDAEFWLEKKSFSPESSESNKLQIRYLLSEERAIANIKIFEASGREVCSLGKNIELSAEGMIEWDGKQEDKSTCRVGLYLAYVEMHSLAGAMRKYKLPFAVIR
nr:lamin tail domain-containing protein [uncultured Bacteroides sp.]